MAGHSIVDVAGISKGESSNNSSKIAENSEGESSNNSSKIAVNSEGESSNNGSKIAGISEGESSNNSSSSSKPCIFIVPDILRRHSPKSFTPNSFSFGPLRHKKKHLKKTEGIKLHYLHKLLDRKPTPQTTQQELYNSILEVEERARKCYAFSTDHLTKDEFVDMLVIDGCFIIELLRNNEIYTKKKDKDNNTIDKDDPVFIVSWVLQVLYHDLILLENQIPWFVLECLFEMTTSPTSPTRPKSVDDKSLIDLALHFIRPNFSEWQLPKIKDDSLKGNHILDHLRNALVSSIGTGQEPTSDHWQLIPTVTSLRKLGIRFKKVKSSKLLDIEFVKHGVLEIPSLTIRATTCEMLRNLISYEQCYPNCEPKITSYAMLLNSLINTTKDIEVLHEAGIIVNHLNPNDTLEFFNNIFTDTYVKTFSYVTICQNVKQYTSRWRPRARAAYVHNHFADPWAIVSQIVAFIVVSLTILQTVFSMLQYFKDS